MTDPAMNPGAPKSDPGGILWSLLAVALLIIGIATINHDWPVMSIPEDRAANYLMTLGSIQLAYADLDANNDYGSFRNLRRTGLVESDDRPTNIIREYHLLTRVSVKPPSMVHEGNLAEFTSVAMPRNKRLRTFALCDDLILRTYGGGDANAPCSWPLLDPEITSELIQRRKDQP